MPSKERAGGKELEIMKSISTQGGRRLGSEVYRMPTTWKQIKDRLIHILAARSISRCSRKERAHEKARQWKWVKSLDSEECPPEILSLLTELQSHPAIPLSDQPIVARLQYIPTYAQKIRTHSSFDREMATEPQSKTRLAGNPSESSSLTGNGCASQNFPAVLSLRF